MHLRNCGSQANLADDSLKNADETTTRSVRRRLLKENFQMVIGQWGEYSSLISIISVVGVSSIRCAHKACRGKRRRNWRKSSWLEQRAGEGTVIGREHNRARRKWRGREEKMESAVPRWQEGSLLAFCQPEGGIVVMVVVCVEGEGGGVTQRKREGERKGQRVIDAG